MQPQREMLVGHAPASDTPPRAKEFIAQNARNQGYRVSIGDDTLVGVISLSFDDIGPPDLGYWLAQCAWGNGYMTEPAGGLLDWHFAQSDGDVLSRWIKYNEPLQNMLSKLGCARHGERQIKACFLGRPAMVVTVSLSAEHRRSESQKARRWRKTLHDWGSAPNPGVYLAK